MSRDEFAFIKVTKGFNHCFEGQDSWGVHGLVKENMIAKGI